MALPHPSLRNSLVSALKYSLRFNYPLTSHELWYWQVFTSYSPSSVTKFLKKHHFPSANSYYYLPGHKKSIATRLLRQTYSQSKWPVAHRVGELLSRIPTIEAIFVTGALAMNNSPKHDDIDFMIVTSPHTLWLTRILVYVFLELYLRARRPTSLPEHSSPRVSNTICDNLYLSASSLQLSTPSLYLAHELLQARPIFDRSHVHYHLLAANVWAKNYLPIAYAQQLAPSQGLKISPLSVSFLHLLISPLNTLLFLVQFIYMYPKISRERISLNSAFFHPRANINLSESRS